MEEDQLEEITSEVFKFKDLVDYQKGTIVSRTLLDRGYTTLTVFAFDEGQNLSEHTAPHDAILQVIDGRVRVTIQGEVYELEEGESIVMPADIPHAVEAVSKFKMFLTMVK